ncbi:MAG: DDE-type integrase/transposase/recombinase [Pseudomonadota bacterium]
MKAAYQEPKTGTPTVGHKVYPYVLRYLVIERPNQVCCSDVGCIPVTRGFLHLVEMTSWFSRLVLSWCLSTSLHIEFRRDALEEASGCYRKPEIFSTDQDAQFTSVAFTAVLIDAEIKVGMDGKARCMDKLFIERLCRSLKHEEVYFYA